VDIYAYIIGSYACIASVAVSLSQITFTFCIVAKFGASQPRDFEITREEEAINDSSKP